MSDFSSFKKNRTKSTDDLKAQMEALEKKNSFVKESDDSLWDIKPDDGGVGLAVIRFLPNIEEDSKFVKVMRYAFKGPILPDGNALWYIEDSLATLGQDDPVAKYNSSLYNKTKATGDKRYENQAKAQKRNVFYVSNILVIQDKQNPENEGKVFRYKYGEKIYQKIKAALFPEFDGETPVDVFDPWDGANFKMKVTLSKFKDPSTGQEREFRNYDACTFGDVSPLFSGDDEKIEKVLKKCYSINEFIDPTKFKTYAELLTKLERVMGAEPGTLFIDSKATESSIKKEEKSSFQEKAKEEVKKVDKEDESIPFKTDSKDDDDDSEEDFFRSLLD